MPLGLELLKIVKLLGVAMLFTGTIGSVLPHDLSDRRRFAYGLAGPGFAVTWIAGFGLAYFEQLALLSWWIVTAIVLSIVSLQVVLFAVGVEGRRSIGTAIAAIVPLIGCVAVMVMRGH
jgi:hypothetical protein